MSDLINLYIYYDSMAEKFLDGTDEGFHQYHHFIQLRDAVAREIETRYA